MTSASNEKIIVHFRQSAGITTPTEYGGYNLVGSNLRRFAGSNTTKSTLRPLPNLTNIVRKISQGRQRTSGSGHGSTCYRHQATKM